MSAVPSAAALPPRRVASVAPVVVRVGLLLDAASCQIQCSSGVLLRTDAGGDPLGASVSVRPTATGIALNATDVAAHAVTLHPGDGAGPMSLDGRAYRGDLVVVRTEAGRLHVVNYVDIDAYIMGVLAGEVPAAWPEESLKAQAVAARSYALNRMASHAPGDWDVVATDRDQVYEGVHGEVPSIARAVLATRGEVLTWQGSIIKAYFHASCGGHTEDVAVAFGENQAPYLKGVADPYCVQSPYQQWGRDYTTNELRAILARSGQVIGPVLAVQAARKDPSGRVEEFVVTDSAGRHSVPGVELRRLLGYRDLRSTFFDVQVKKSIPVSFTTTHDEWKRIEKTEVYFVPEEVEVGMEETSQQQEVVKPGDAFYVMAGSGTLDKSRAGYAFAATEEGVMRTFAVRPGLSVIGLDRQVVITKFKVRRKHERVTEQKVKATKKEQHSKRLPVVLRFAGRGWGHGVGLCQWGARGMAMQGFGYRDILAHYYPGAEIRVAGSAR